MGYNTNGQTGWAYSNDALGGYNSGLGGYNTGLSGYNTGLGGYSSGVSGYNGVLNGGASYGYPANGATGYSYNGGYNYNNPYAYNRNRVIGLQNPYTSSSGYYNQNRGW